MAEKNLIQLIKCREKLSLKNYFAKFSLNSISNQIKGVGTLLKTQFISLITTLAKEVLDPINNVVNAIAAIALKLKQLKLPKFEIPSLSDFGIDTSCPEDSPTAKPTVDIAGEAKAGPRINNKEATNPITTIFTKTEDSQTKDLTSVAKQISEADQKMNTMGISEKRELVRQFANIHSILIPFINTLPNFQPVSESVLSSLFAYTVDKPSLPLGMWSNTAPSNFTPVAVRKNISLKVPKDTYEELENSYRSLNQKFASNISQEVTPTNLQSPPVLNKAHGLHISGDYQYLLDHIEPSDETSLKALTMTNLLREIPNVSSQLDRVNYVTPIDTTGIVKTNDTYVVTVEKEEIPLNNRGDKVVPPFTSLNKTAITPVLLP